MSEVYYLVYPYLIIKIIDSNFFYLIFFSLLRNPLAQMEEERKEHEIKMKKMEQELEQVFELKVKEKMQKLKDSEADVSIYVCYKLFILFKLFLNIKYVSLIDCYCL